MAARQSARPGKASISKTYSTGVPGTPVGKSRFASALPGRPGARGGSSTEPNYAPRSFYPYEIRGCPGSHFPTGVPGTPVEKPRIWRCRILQNRKPGFSSSVSFSSHLAFPFLFSTLPPSTPYPLMSEQKRRGKTIKRRTKHREGGKEKPRERKH